MAGIVKWEPRERPPRLHLCLVCWRRAWSWSDLRRSFLAWHTPEGWRVHYLRNCALRQRSFVNFPFWIFYSRIIESKIRLLHFQWLHISVELLTEKRRVAAHWRLRRTRFPNRRRRATSQNIQICFFVLWNWSPSTQHLRIVAEKRSVGIDAHSTHTSSHRSPWGQCHETRGSLHCSVDIKIDALLISASNAGWSSQRRSFTSASLVKLHHLFLISSLFKVRAHACNLCLNSSQPGLFSHHRWLGGTSKS